MFEQNVDPLSTSTLDFIMEVVIRKRSLARYLRSRSEVSYAHWEGLALSSRLRTSMLSVGDAFERTLLCALHPQLSADRISDALSRFTCVGDAIELALLTYGVLLSAPSPMLV